MEILEETTQGGNKLHPIFGSDVEPESWIKKNDSSDGATLIHDNSLPLTITRRITSTGLRISALDKSEGGTKDQDIDSGLMLKTRVKDEPETGDGNDAVLKGEVDGYGCSQKMDLAPESVRKMSFDDFLEATNTKVMSQEECLKTQFGDHPVPTAAYVPVVDKIDNGVESVYRVKEEPDIGNDVFHAEMKGSRCAHEMGTVSVSELAKKMSSNEFLQATDTKVMFQKECSRTQFPVQPMPLTVVTPAAVNAYHRQESRIRIKEEPDVGNETQIDVKHDIQEPKSVIAEPFNEAVGIVSTEIMPAQEPIISAKEEVVDSECIITEAPKLAMVPYASESKKNEGGRHRTSPWDIPARKVKVEDRTVSCVVVEDWDFPEDPDWYLVGRKVVFATSTAKGRKLHNNEIVHFNFPATSSRTNSPLIVRFSTNRYGEIGRLPMEWAKCVVPLVRSTKVEVLGRCIDGDKNLKIGDTITLYMSYYIHHTIFTEDRDTSWNFDARANIDSTIYPLLTLFDMLDIKPYQKAEFTPQELVSRKRVLDLEGDSGEVSSMLPMVKRRNGCEKHPEQAQNEQVVSESTLNKLVGAAEVYDLEEVEPPKTLLCDLKPYQKQALGWMSGLEEGIDVEKAAKTLHPCWSAYRICDKRASSIYLNNFSGEATTQLPSAMQMARGGILADAMGLGKTVMTIALILARPGRGRQDSEEAAAVDDGESRKRKRCSRSTTIKAKGGTLVVCPMALLGQWKDELETHSVEGSISIFVHYGGDRTNDPKIISQYDVILTTYGVLTAAYKYDGENSIFHRVNWYRVVLDEAHTIKASRTQGAQAAFSLSSYCRWCLTGTPLQNNLEDLYSLLCFLHVEPWCNWAWWNKLIQKPYENGDPRGLRTVKAILRPLMLRRTKETKDKEGRPILVLPPTNIQIIECEQSEAERDFYDALFKRSKVQFDQFVAQGKVLHNYANILELLLRLRQCCNHPFLVMSRADSQKYADLNKLSRRFLESSSDSNSTKQKVPSRAYVEEVVEGIRKGENAECPICLESADDPVLTPCAHRMCRECLLSSWRSPTMGHCPLCRELLKKADLITCPSVGCFRIDVEKNWKESSKISALLNCLEEIRRSGSSEKCIVFSQWTAFLDLLEIPLKRKRIGFLRFDGQLAQKQREKVLKEFNETREKMVLLMSLKAGGVGLNLTAASNVFLMDPWWNPAVEEQAIMRIHRIGQKREVVVRRFIVLDTVEERMQQVQVRKQRMIAGALTDEEVRTARLEELKMLFR